jgi:cytolysin-activating lysine-acyltransferase
MSSQHTAPAPAADKFAVLGKLAWLWMNSPLHRDWTVDLLSGFALPPIELGQYLLLERDGMPVAYCSWAHLSSRAEAAYMLDASHIALADWNGGDHLWFVDWVAPFGKADSWEMKKQLEEKFPTSVARAIRVKRGGRTARVMEFRGPGMDRQAARALLTRCYEDFLKVLEARKAVFQANHGAAEAPAKEPFGVEGPAGKPHPARTAA